MSPMFPVCSVTYVPGLYRPAGRLTQSVLALASTASTLPTIWGASEEQAKEALLTTYYAFLSTDHQL